MLILNFNPISVIISILILSGVLVHGAHVDNFVVEPGLSEHKQKISSNSSHTHIEMSAFTNSTHDLRSQTPSNRPRDDDDKDNSTKKRVSGDNFGGDLTSLVSL